MSARKLLILFRGACASLVIGLLAATPALAATSSTSTTSGNGLKVSPVTTNLTMNPGDSQTLPIYVQNVTSSAITLQVLINDFTAASGESGQPALLLDPTATAPSHSLKKFVAPISDVSLNAGEQKIINVVITIPKGTSGGGYYGAIRFAPSTTSSNSNVTLSASVGSLILVKVTGTYKEQLLLDSFDVRANADASPQVVFTSGNNIVVAARFENKGDVQEQPFGKVLLKQGDHQLAAYELNNTTPRGNVLPDSIRKFTVKLDKVGFFGQYTVTAAFGYGSNGQLLQGSTTFYVVPVGAILAVLVLILLALFFIFVFPKIMRAYNARVIRNASRR